jgi:hypothetical protein
MRAVLDKLQNPPVLAAGLWGLAIILIVDVYQNLWDIFHFDWYRVMQADLPDWLVCLRYVISITLRILMLWAAAGILARSEQHRKLLLGICGFNIVTLFWHHRYSSFLYISSYLGLNIEDYTQNMLLFGHWYYPGTVARMLNAYVWDLFLAFISIVFLTNPNVKRLFR